MDGELRSHLVFEPISVNAPAPSQSGDGSQLSLSLEFRSVVSIPVIVRHGRLGATATLSEATIARAGTDWVAKFKLGRSGNRSLRGDLIATFISSDGTRKTSLGKLAGLAVYCPNTERVVEMHLERDPSSLGKGKIELKFAEIDKSRGAAETKAEIAVVG
jgi:hypothetical protein